MKILNVLLAEDDIGQRATYAGILRQLQCEVIEAGDGVQAFNLAQQHTFDAIVTDYGMPIMDGLELLQALNRRQGNIPTLFHSADAKINELPIEEFGQVFDNVTGHRKHFDIGKSKEYLTRFITSIKK